VTRLRAHFDSVDRELRARDVSHLSTGQRAMRATLIAWLGDYRNAGVFPENDKFPDRAVPFFRDSHGTLCAMAYLIDRSGGSDIVDHVAKTRNNAFIRELTGERALVSWLEESGLSVDEAARIQPTYGGFPLIVENNDRVTTSYALLSMGLGGASLGSLGVNLFAPSRASGGVGLVTGIATIIAGVARLDDDGSGNQKVAIANTAVGSLAAVGALRALFSLRQGTAHVTNRAEKGKLFGAATIAPDVVMTPNGARAGLTLRARF
jgi:hypothetical protein